MFQSLSTVIPRLTSDPANKDFFHCFRTRLMNVLVDARANMNGRAIPRAYHFRLYVCDKEMSWPYHIGETHQPDWVVYVWDREKWDAW
jgi:hypothetical protein